MLVHNLKFGLSGEIIFGQYATGETAIQIMNEGELVAVATVNLEAWDQQKASYNQIWIKTWSENEGMDVALFSAGVIEKPYVKEVYGGYNNICRAVLANLTPAAIAERDSQKGT